MKILHFIFYLSFLNPLIASTQILVDTSVLNNMEKWSVKGESAFSWNLFKPDFGPFETIDINKGKKDRENLGKSTSLLGGSGTLGLVKTVDKKVSQPLTLTALYNVTDSIFIDMLMVNISRNTKEIIQFGKNKQEDYGSMLTYVEETVIHTNRDTSLWHMKTLPNQRLSFEVQDYSEEKCLLSNNADSFEIRSASGFLIKGQIRKNRLLWTSSGFAFLTGDKQVAVVQTAPEINVWMKKDLTENVKQIIGGAIISIISRIR